jgi:hypothetical protein
VTDLNSVVTKFSNAVSRAFINARIRASQMPLPTKEKG